MPLGSTEAFPLPFIRAKVPTAWTSRRMVANDRALGQHVFHLSGKDVDGRVAFVHEHMAFHVVEGLGVRGRVFGVRDSKAWPAAAVFRGRLLHDGGLRFAVR